MDSYLPSTGICFNCLEFSLQDFASLFSPEYNGKPSSGIQAEYARIQSSSQKE